MTVFKLIVLYQTIVPVTETSYKMASTLGQKWLIIFLVKKLKFFYSSDHKILFQISPACGPNTYQIMYGETLDFQCQYQKW